MRDRRARCFLRRCGVPVGGVDGRAGSEDLACKRRGYRKTGTSSQEVQSLMGSRAPTRRSHRLNPPDPLDRFSDDLLRFLLCRTSCRHLAVPASSIGILHPSAFQGHIGRHGSGSSLFLGHSYDKCSTTELIESIQLFWSIRAFKTQHGVLESRQRQCMSPANERSEVAGPYT